MGRRSRSPALRLLAGIAVLGVVMGMSACAWDRRDRARQVTEHVGGLPGVASTSMAYDAKAPEGARFSLVVTLAPSVSESQAQAIGTTFAGDVGSLTFAFHEISLVIDMPPEEGGDASASVARFTFGGTFPPSSTAADIGAGISGWLRAVRSPVADRVMLTAGRLDQGVATRDITIYLHPEASAAAALALQDNDPVLADATWSLRLAPDGPRGRDQDSLGDDHEFLSQPRPLDEHEKSLWTQINELVGAANHASGVAGSPFGHPHQGDIAINVGIAYGPDEIEQGRRIGYAVAALLPQFGRPVALELDYGEGPVEIIVGGCYRHEGYHTPLPMETDLSRRYERC
jgi:hypothetical protein